MLQSSFGDPPPKARDTETEQEAIAAQDDEPTPDDIQEEEAPSQTANGDEFEIVHNGQQVKLSRADTIKLAQQGFDYDRKAQHVAEQRKAVEAQLQRAQSIEQMIPHVAQELATVQAIESQIRQYNGIDWVRLATDDPLEYPKHRAQYDQLVQAYNASRQSLDQKAAILGQEKQRLTAEQLQHESTLLAERIPEWKDPAKREAGVKDLRGYLLKEGVPESDIDGLNSSLVIAIARKAMLYDRLKSLKTDKTKQLRDAPPVVRPGAAVPGDKGRTNFKAATQSIRKMGQQGRHGDQEKLMIAMLGKTFK